VSQIDGQIRAELCSLLGALAPRSHKLQVAIQAASPTHPHRWALFLSACDLVLATAGELLANTADLSCEPCVNVCRADVLDRTVALSTAVAMQYDAATVSGSPQPSPHRAAKGLGLLDADVRQARGVAAHSDAASHEGFHTSHDTALSNRRAKKMRRCADRIALRS